MEPTQAQPAQEKTVKVKILKFVGPHAPGDIVDMPESQAKAVCNVGSFSNGEKDTLHQKAMLLEDYEALDATPGQPGEMTMKDFADRNMKNVVDSNSDLHKTAMAESLALSGTPVSSSEPFVATGPITPPTTVNASLAKSSKRPHVSADSIFPKDEGKAKAAAPKKEEPKKEDAPKAEVKK